MRPLLVAALALAGFGSAQAQTTTQCSPTIVGMPSAGMTCRSAPTFPAPVPASADTAIDPATVPAKRCNALERLGDERLCAARAAAADRADFAKTVGSLAAEGKCDDARRAALKGGDFDLAERIMRLCLPAQPTP
jgi:hypothetical protein